MKPDDEARRLQALRGLAILDTPPEEPFAHIVRLVTQVLRVPVCAVSLIDGDRQWFKAQMGLDMREAPRLGAFCAQAIAQATTLAVPDARADARFADHKLVVSAPFIRSYAGVPLRTQAGYAVGTLCAMDTQTRDFTPDALGILAGFGRLAEDALQRRQNAATDPLTGALSRAAWTERAQMELGRARRYGRNLSVAMLHIDRFKAITESHDHAAGDVVIRHVAELCCLALRQSDALGRYGGEAFVLLMPETSAGEAFTVAERIRRVFANNPNDVGRPVYCTVSIGVAELEAADASVACLLDRAGRALARAKQGGRNCTYIGHAIVRGRAR